jgi:hypothetical protein
MIMKTSTKTDSQLHPDLTMKALWSIETFMIMKT